MANTVNITTSYSYSGPLTLNGSNSYRYTQSGSGAAADVRTISGVNTAVNSFLGLSSIRLLFIENQNEASGYLSFSQNFNQSPSMLIAPGESYIFPIYGTGGWVSGLGGTGIYCAFIANET